MQLGRFLRCVARVPNGALGSWLAARGAALCATTALVGCVQILGYGEGNEFGPCRSATDCPPGEVCGSGLRCEMPSAATCAPSCAPLQVCSNSLCYQGIPYGQSDNGSGGHSVTTAQLLECIQLPMVPDCGVLTGVGIVTYLDVDSDFRFAVYDDESGRPTNRLAQSDRLRIRGSKAQIPVRPEFHIGRCSSGESGYYWICFVASSEFVYLETADASGLWAEGAALDQIPGYLSSGLPEMSPTNGPTHSAMTAALIYALIAQPK